MKRGKRNLKGSKLGEEASSSTIKRNKHLSGSQGGNSSRKHQEINENSDNGSDTITLQDQPHTIKTSSLKKSQRLAETKISYCTPQKRIVPMHQKMTFSSVMVKGQDKAAKKSEGRLEKTKSPTVKQLASIK
ncbi:uncharacterized protein LOC120207613 [Hibiscus syriacus]|uniref:uncharacterized protein LOC120207613 n=1 Tax=Hibiscus syriacus TaxID=106335 RepID=UPI0019224CEE|nr:uncharacterized protein LOC120207613 [Hibiscus syriacus]